MLNTTEMLNRTVNGYVRTKEVKKGKLRLNGNGRAIA